MERINQSQKICFWLLASVCAVLLAYYSPPPSLSKILKSGLLDFQKPRYPKSSRTYGMFVDSPNFKNQAKHFRHQYQGPSQEQTPPRVIDKNPMNGNNGIYRYFAWCEKKLEALVIEEGLQVGVLKIKRCPLVICFWLRLLNPSRHNLNKLLGLGAVLA